MLFITILKQQLKKPITLLLMLVVCLLITLNMFQVEKSRENRSFIGHDSYLNSKRQTSFLSSAMTGINLWAKYPIAARSYEVFDQTSFNIAKAAMSGDSRETLRLNIFYNLQFVKYIRDSNLPIEVERLKDDIYEIWPEVSNGVAYEDIDFKPQSAEAGIEARLLLEARSWYTLYQNEMEPTYRDEANNITLWYNFLYDVGPMTFILIPLLLAYTAVNMDLNSGVLKLLLTQSVSRKRYYFSKWLASVIQALTVILTPALLMGLFYGLKNGFISLIYPVTYLSKVWTRLVPIPNYIEVVMKYGMQPNLGNYTFMHMAPANAFVSDFIQPHQGIDLISFWQYALIGLLILVLYVMFITALVQLMSALFNNGIVSLAISAVVIGGGIGLTHFMTIGEHYNVIPLNFFRIGRIIEGTQNVTVLGAVLMLLLSLGVFLFGGIKYFERKVV